MRRELLRYLDFWRVSKRRKPLIIKGARQVGKTYVLKTWGQASFPRVHYINFEKNTAAARSFERDFDVNRILNELSFNLDTSIVPATDLLIFDEIQACPKAMTALKYFCEDMPQLAVACAGSLLGVILSPESFPVGKVQFLHLRPMSFPEFLNEVDTRRSLDHLPAPSIEAYIHASIPDVIHEHLWDLLRIYYVTGGMPEAVSILADSRVLGTPKLRMVLDEVRSTQRSIVSSYENDFAKHAGNVNATHIHALYHNIPSQLASVHDESIRRFQFGAVIPGKKGFAAWERPVQWLKNAGLACQIKIVNHAELPLEHFTKPNMFKLIPHDVGLLGCMLDLPPSVLMSQDFGMAKGYFAEVYVAQAILAAAPADKDQQLYGWSEGESEIEFLVSSERGPVPVEVKSGRRTKARSLGQYISKYKPEFAICLSMKPWSWSADRRLLNLPLPLAHCIGSLTPI